MSNHPPDRPHLHPYHARYYALATVADSIVAMIRAQPHRIPPTQSDRVEPTRQSHILDMVGYCYMCHGHNQFKTNVFIEANG